MQPVADAHRHLGVRPAYPFYRGHRPGLPSRPGCGFAPRWPVDEILRRGIGHDRVLFASDEPWGGRAGEYARLRAAAGDGEFADLMFRGTFEKLYG
jgi:hypothetical protein